MRSKIILSGTLLTLGLTAAVMTPEHVQAKSSKVTYTVKNQVMTVKGKGMMPDNMNFGKKKKTKNIKKLIVKKGVTSISEGAFKGCKKLKKIKLSSTVVKIAKNAFSGTALTNVTIPKNVKYMGNNAFLNCKKLKKVSVPTDIQVYDLDEFETAVLNTKVLDTLKFTTSIKSLDWITFNQFLTENYEVSDKDKKYSTHNGDIYSKDGKELLYVSGSKTDFSLSEACTAVNLSAFVHYRGDDYTSCCVNIKKIEIPKTVKKVYGCTDEHDFPNTEFSVDSSNMDKESVKNLVEFFGKEKAAQLMPEDVKVSGDIVIIRGESFNMEYGYLEEISKDDSSADSTSTGNETGEDTIVWKNPDEINCTEKDYTDSFKFTSVSAGKWVKLNMKKDGIFIIWANEDINLYDGQKNKINLLPVVKSGDVLYIQLPEKITETYKIKGAYIRSFNSDEIQLNDEDRLMNATGSSQYLNFTVKKKMVVDCRIADYKNDGLGKISFITQKKNGSKWINVSAKRTLKTGKNWDYYSHSGGTGSFARHFYIPLEKGTYRFKLNGKKGSVYEVFAAESYHDCLAPEKYGYTKKKAVELFDFDPNIDTGIYTYEDELDSYRVGNFVYSGKNTHWYKLTKDKKKQGKISVGLEGASAGTVKISIYKKGKKKALKTKTIKPSTVLNNEKKSGDMITFNYKVKKKGIYYIKIQRDKKTTITPYTCSLSYKK